MKEKLNSIRARVLHSLIYIYSFSYSHLCKLKKNHTKRLKVNYFLYVCIFYRSQTKNVENKTSTIQQPPPSTSSSSSSSTSTSTRTEKPPTTTYKAFTTSYKSTPAQRTHWNHTVIQRGDKLSDHERLKLRKEFFETYDVMTGIRIAATLGSFFVLMVFLIVYKSRSHTHKALKVSFIEFLYTL